MNHPKPSRRSLVKQVTCPRCWKSFAPHEVKWIAAHQSLIGDKVAGEHEALRFLPSRFNLAGDAIDEGKEACRQLACPYCHGRIHDALLEVPSLYLSIVGAPGSGKSFYLGAMLHQFESGAAARFGVRFANIDPVANKRPMSHTRIFEPSAQKGWVSIPRNQPVEDDYHRARINGQDITYPGPYLYQLTPTQSDSPASMSTARVLCLYDVAGETFLPGYHADRKPAGDHLALSKVLLFVFDPTLQPGFRAACARLSADPQFDSRLVIEKDQTEIIAAAAERIRVLTKRSATEVSDQTLIVIVNKYDAWKYLMEPEPAALDSAVKIESNGRAVLDVLAIERVSRQQRELMLLHAKRVVHAAEAAFRRVIYIPVTATSGPPQPVTETGDRGRKETLLKFREGTLNPRWVELPALYALHLVQADEPTPLVPARNLQSL